MEGRDLPMGWELIRLSEAAKWGSGGTPSRRNLDYYGGKIPWIKTGELGPRYIMRTEETISDLGLVNSSAKIFPKGSIAVAMYGATIGKVSILGIPAATNQACAVAAVNLGACSPEFFFHYLCSQRDEFVKAGKGGAQPNISQGLIKDWPFPLAPLNEQRRISDKLDTTLAAVEACRQRLDGVAVILKRFRQAVLAAATTGELTREWREERDREQDWETSSIKSIAEVGTGSTPLRSNQSFYSADGMPWITSAATSDELITTANEFVTESGIKAGRLRIFPEGTLLVAMYGEGKTRGQVSELGIAATINQACAAIHSPSEQHLMPFIKIALKANYLEMRQLAEGGTQPNLNLSKIKEFMIRVPPKDEVFEICDQVELFLSLADQLEAKLATACRIVNRLTPALLAKAFRGELVPQDPNDEPASELLAKLKAKQSYAAHVSPRRRAKPPTQRQAMSIPDKDSIKAVILSLKTDRFSFDELRDQAGGDYESLKGVLFELLEEPSPVVRQVFDQEAKAMQLERIRP